MIILVDKAVDVSTTEFLLKTAPSFNHHILHIYSFNATLSESSVMFKLTDKVTLETKI